jgi:hypothetical protein
MTNDKDTRKCYLLASMLSTHAEACELAIRKGYAEDLMDFDEKVREFEDNGESQ